MDQSPQDDPRRPGPVVVVAFLLAVALTIVAAIGFGVLRSRDPASSEVRIGPPRGEIAVAYPHMPLSLNPYTFEGDTIATRDLLRPLLPRLLEIGPDLDYRPSLAVRVPRGGDISTTPFTVTFHLDPRAVWSDGVPVTAEDVRFTWQAILDPTFPAADRSAYRHVKDAVVVDPHTVRLEFDTFYVWWPDLFSAGDFVLPKHDLEGKDLGSELRAGIRVGAGPFLLESWTPGLEMVYVANPRWWGRGPGFERVRVSFVPAVEVAIQLLERGRVQAMSTTTEPNIAMRMKANPATRVSARYGSAWWELALQNGRPATGNAGFRQAIAAAVDRQRMAEAFGGADGRALDTLAPGWRPGGSKVFGDLAFDPDRAGRLLAESGVKPGPLAMAGPANSELADALQGAIQTGLARVGITVEVGNPDEEEFYGEWLREGRFDLGVVERRGSPMMAMAGGYRSTLQPPAGVNYYRLSSPAVDETLDVVESVEKADKTLPDVLMRRLAAALPAIPLVEVKAFIAYRPVIAGPSANATVEGPFWNLEEWRPQS
jgi:peptide/nickel transport system substrate-binding protein